MWPFNPHPKNEVTWLPDANGIRFGYAGIAFTETSLQPAPSKLAPDGCAIELWLRSSAADPSGNMLTFSAADNPEGIVLRQWRDSLLLYRATQPGPLEVKSIEFDVDGMLQTGRPVQVTISSGPDGTIFYADGKKVAASRTFKIFPADLHRQVVLGSASTNFQPWQGDIRGLAVYDAELSAAEVSAHYAEWVAGDSSSGLRLDQDREHLVARYEFRERAGTEIHSALASAPPIKIPVHFTIPRKPMLASPAEEFEAKWVWLHDVLVNIVGFMPLGFVLGGYFALSRSRPKAILLAWLCGGLLSFTIEFLQYYIPRRGSGWTDVITNSTGALLGALLARPELVWGALRLVNLVPPKNERNVAN